MSVDRGLVALDREVVTISSKEKGALFMAVSHISRKGELLFNRRGIRPPHFLHSALDRKSVSFGPGDLSFPNCSDLQVSARLKGPGLGS